MTESWRILVKGRVQGVCFRANTQKQAVKLNLSGFVRNLPDGQVEIFASGDSEALRQLVAWCRKGPILAKVTDVIVSPYNAGEIWIDFAIR